MSNIILSFKELNELKDTIYATEVAHGFHDEKHTVDHELGMVLSEIGEAIDADRNPNAPVPTQKTIDEILKLPLGGGSSPISTTISKAAWWRNWQTWLCGCWTWQGVSM